MLFGLELTTVQEAFIQNLICSAAEERTALSLNPSNFQEFMQIEAALTGQIRILQHVLDASSICRRAKSSGV